MQENRSEKSEKPTEFAVPTMSAVCEASDLLRAISEPCPPGDSVKAAINRAARRVSKFMAQPMRPGRAEDIWRKEARSIRSEEMDALRAAARREKAILDEAMDLEARLARIEAALSSINPLFDSEVLDEIRRAARPLGQSSREVMR